MLRKVKMFFSSFVLMIIFLSFSFGSSVALKSESQARSPFAQVATPTIPLPEVSDVVPFSKLIQNDITLTSPYGSDGISFSVPPSWRLSEGASLSLFLTVSFNSGASTTGTTASSGAAGTLTIRLNNTVLSVISLDQVGDSTYQISIPTEALIPLNVDGVQELGFTLDSGWSCYINQTTTVIVRTSSLLTLPHENVTPSTNFNAFPAPIYQDYSLYKVPALIVVPDNATPSEIQAAFTLASGLGGISSGKLSLTLTTISKLTSEQVSTMNLILVGRAATFGYSSELKLPLTVTNGKFDNSNGNPDDGIIEMINSPWAADKVVFIVSGNTDAGVVKAAQAVSTGKLRSSLYPNLAVVDQVSATSSTTNSSIDQTFKDLGYKNRILSNIGVNYASFKFYIPPGQTISEGAYVDLYYGHSAMIQFENSGIVAFLNGTPIGSVAFTKDSALEAINHVQINIPTSTVLAGDNLLELRVTLFPMDKCSRPTSQAMYTNIWSDSAFHLPLRSSPVTGLAANYDLRAYPAPFAYDSTLSDTAFILPKGDLELWQNAFSVAFYLGSRANGPVSMPKVFFDGSLPDEEKSKYNFILLGKPSELSTIQEINSVLPAPFTGGSDIIKEPPMQVVYRVDPGATIGYIEMAESPWNKDKIVIAALGTNVQGLVWATAPLIAPGNWKLAGNFAAINDQQIFTADTRIYALAVSATPNALGTVSPEAIVTPSLLISPPAPYHPVWLVPTLVVMSISVVGTLIAAVYIYLSRNRKKTRNLISEVDDTPDK